ncbi:hypothetical protein A3Q56_00194 [Intoshia linei]|uniref:DNA polymerase kappa n=1 Tax=Intoshia linei TaxID=1819745 RepID=A0A177BER6_9BILA|nr:hypothetical protein A3Q56_00194 [Intoshia linei]
METTELNDNKAGMTNLDIEKINEIIEKASFGSKFYQNEKIKTERVNNRIIEYKKKLKEADTSVLSFCKRKTEKIKERLEQCRETNKTFIYIDMDAFFANVEIRDNPSLADKPIAVGSESMLSTSNYIARRFGVRAAMPGFIAKKLCPNLIIIPSNYEKYQNISFKIKQIFRKYDSNFISFGLDEALLNITHLLTNLTDNYAYKKAQDISTSIRINIFKETNVTASAGIGCNRMLAKLAADINKPNGQYLVYSNSNIIKDLMKNIKVKKICGIGKVTSGLLSSANVITCLDILENSDKLLYLFGEEATTHFISIALGIEKTAFKRSEYQKSISTESTFKPISKFSELTSIIEQFCLYLYNEIQNQNLCFKTIVLKLKKENFTVMTRSTTLEAFTNKFDRIKEKAIQLLKNELNLNINIDEHTKLPYKIRLIGLKLSNLKLAKKEFVMLKYLKKRDKPSTINIEFNKQLEKKKKDIKIFNYFKPTNGEKFPIFKNAVRKTAQKRCYNDATCKNNVQIPSIMDIIKLGIQKDKYPQKSKN